MRPDAGAFPDRTEHGRRRPGSGRHSTGVKHRAPGPSPARAPRPSGWRWCVARLSAGESRLVRVQVRAELAWQLVLLVSIVVPPPRGELVAGSWRPPWRVTVPSRSIAGRRSSARRPRPRSAPRTPASYAPRRACSGREEATHASWRSSSTTTSPGRSVGTGLRPGEPAVDRAVEDEGRAQAALIEHGQDGRRFRWAVRRGGHHPRAALRPPAAPDTAVVTPGLAHAQRGLPPAAA